MSEKEVFEPEEPLTQKEERAAMRLRIAQIDVDIAMMHKEKAQLRRLLSTK